MSKTSALTIKLAVWSEIREMVHATAGGHDSLCILWQLLVILPPTFLPNQINPVANLNFLPLFFHNIFIEETRLLLIILLWGNFCMEKSIMWNLKRTHPALILMKVFRTNDFRTPTVPCASLKCVVVSSERCSCMTSGLRSIITYVISF